MLGVGIKDDFRSYEMQCQLWLSSLRVRKFMNESLSAQDWETRAMYAVLSRGFCADILDWKDVSYPSFSSGGRQLV